MSSQNVYFGYPQNEVSFRKGDIIVVNIPSFYLTGYYFVQDSQLDNLSLFTNKYDSLSFRIEINFCLGRCFDTSYCMEVSNILKEQGAKDIYVCVSHGIFSHNAITRIEDSMIKEVVVTNTITIPQEELQQSTKIKTLSIGWMLSKLILAVSCHTPVSEVYSLYEDK